MTEPGSLVLFGEPFWISPYVFSSFVALTEKGLPFTVRILSLNDREHHQPAYRDYALTATVPALEHDGLWVAESSAINEYLEERFAPPAHAPLLPRAIGQRARARHVTSWLRSDLMALRDERPTTSMFYERAETPLSPAGSAAAATLVRVADALIPDSAGPLFGDWTIVDADLAFMLHRLLLNGHALPAKIRAYAEAQWQRPSVRAYVEHARPAAFVPRP